VTYPWLDDPSGSGPEPHFPWEDDPEASETARPIYKPGGERRVQVLRRIDPWSVLKASLVMYLCFFAVALVVGSGLWVLARQTGFLADVESLVEDLGLYVEGSYHFRDGYILRMVAVIGPLLAVVAALVTTAAAGVYNLVARLTGGVEVAVTEEAA
jgi:hypothetical protein